MIIKSIQLHNFRNYEDLKIEFTKGTNILYGENAQGKTNILEAANLSSTTKSHKGSKDKEMIRFGQEEAHIKTIIEKKQTLYEIDLHLKKQKNKGVALNRIPLKKASELFGILNLIFFSPEDLSIIKNGPAERRRFMDAELCQMDKVYLSDLINYQKALNQRNRLLKEIPGKKELKETLILWNEHLARYGISIIKRRRRFMEEINEIVRDIHFHISGEKETLILKYEPNIHENHFSEELIKAEERDLYQQFTTVGPHRDDVSFFINDIDIRRYGSQGQQRTSALSLKLAEIVMMKKSIGDTPVLLLDDVLSELDSHRQNMLLDQIHDIQTIITCTGLDEFIRNRFPLDRIFYVKEGTVSLKENSLRMMNGGNQK